MHRSTWGGGGGAGPRIPLGPVGVMGLVPPMGAPRGGTGTSGSYR